MISYRQYLTENIEKYDDVSFFYDQAVKLGHRIPEKEEKIIKDPFTAYKYARWIIKDRWPEAEDTILHSQYRTIYLKFIYNNFIWLSSLLKKKWLQENIIKFDDNDIDVLRYFRMGKEIQEYLLENRPDLIYFIPEIDPELEEKYKHELGLSKIEI